MHPQQPGLIQQTRSQETQNQEHGLCQKSTFVSSEEKILGEISLKFVCLGLH